MPVGADNLFAATGKSSLAFELQVKSLEWAQETLPRE